MANKYYTPSGEPVDLSRARAVQLRAEFASIEQGFARLQIDTDRAVKLRQGETVEILDEPSVRAGGVLAFDSSGKLVVFGKATDTSRAGKILGWDATTGTLKYWDYASTITSPVNAAAASAASAAASASAAAQSATNAANSATAAAQSEVKAFQWAENPADVEVESGKYSAKHWAITAQQVAGNAAASASAAAQSEVKAFQWAENPADVEVESGKYSAKHWAITAQQVAGNAAASAASAAQSATNAAASAASAAQSATNAAASATAAANIFDAFDDRYLGAKASDPATDNDGNALQVGALYFNTTAGAMRAWNGSAWVSAYSTIETHTHTASQISDSTAVGRAVLTAADAAAARAAIGVAPPISVTGPTSVYVTMTVTLTITDLDDFDAYTVTASHGTVSRSGATITYTAPATVPSGGTATLTIQRGSGSRSVAMQILPHAVLPPTVTVTGAPSDVSESPVIGTSAFQAVGVSDTHASTTWRVRKVADGAVVWESVNDSTNLTQIIVPSGILQENTQYRFEAIHNGATLGASEVGYVEATTKAQFAQIIGLLQVATGGGAGTYVRIDEHFAPKATDAAFFNNHPTYSGIVQQTIDGQSMIKIPKFYFKAGTVPSGTYAGKAYWMISDQPVSGFSVHPAFIGADGVELDQIWVGKYQASASGGKLQSVGGVLPRVSMEFPTARAEAYARNTGGVTGFRLWSIYDLSAIQMLASIEMGGLDMQSLIDQGCVNASSAANVDAADVAQATWRGIVGLWGNVWQMVDGIKRRDGTWWFWQYNVPGNTTTSDFATGYINTGRAALASGGWPVTFDTTLLSAGIIVPATVDGTASNGSTGDYFYSNTSTDDRIAYHGGYWGYGANAGLFSLHVDFAPSDASGGLGARLAKV